MWDENADIITCDKNFCGSNYSLACKKELMVFGRMCCGLAQSEYLMDVFDQCGNPDGAPDCCRNSAMAEHRHRNYSKYPWISQSILNPSRFEYFYRVAPYYPVVFMLPQKPFPQVC